MRGINPERERERERQTDRETERERERERERWKRWKYRVWLKSGLLVSALQEDRRGS